MPTITDDAIALRHWEYSETSQTVALFTRAHGVVRAMAKGAKREKGAFSGGVEVLTRGRMVAIVKQSTDLATLTSWDLLAVYWRTRSELPAHRAGLYLVDPVYHAITDHDPHEGLYDAMIGSLDGIEAGADAGEILLRFQWALLTEIGSRPELDLPDGGPGRAWFLPSEGRATAEKSPGAWPVRRATLAHILGSGSANGDATGADAQATSRAGRFLAEYLVFVLDRDLATRRAIYGPTVAVRRG